MGLFSRRNLQRIILDSRGFLTSSQVGEFLNRLNGKDADHRLSAEWEICVLSALSKLGRVQYEPRVPGTSKVDLLFDHEVGNALIEVTGVSDAGLDEDNPVELMTEHLIRHITGAGLNPDNFSLKIEGNWKELYLGGPKATLGLPPPKHFGTLIFNDSLQQFLRRVAGSQSKQKFQVGNPGSPGAISITFDAGGGGFSLNYLQYKVPFTVDNNPVYNRLKKKSTQLKKAQFQGSKGVVICDAGCDVLNRQGRRGLDFGVDDIIRSFLRKHSSIAFVLTLLVKSDGTLLFGPEHLRIVSHLYPSPKFSNVRVADLLQCGVADQFPRPETTPINASTVCDEGRSFYGGSIMAGRSVKISARTLMGLLSGRIKQDDFVRDHPGVAAQLDRMLSHGCMIEEAKVEQCSERDDDWIELSFSDRDAAISPYHNGRSVPSPEK
jgi:hypothetical protein